MILGGNPVYDAPIDLDWSTAQAKAEQSIYIGQSVNETSAVSNVFIARSHYLESWGDGRTFDGTLVPVQPMIEPLFDTFNELEILPLPWSLAIGLPAAIGIMKIGEANCLLKNGSMNLHRIILFSLIA